jgi:hypothetical protein
MLHQRRKPAREVSTNGIPQSGLEQMRTRRRKSEPLISIKSRATVERIAASEVPFQRTVLPSS